MLRQQGTADCGVAALALTAEIPYDRALRAVMEVIGEDPIEGLTNRELLAAAARLEVPLVATRAYNLDVDEGVLRVRFGRKDQTGHWVALKRGLILCPTDGLAFPWQKYLRANDGRACTLLKGGA
jgi:hypothetical protein